MPTRIGKTFKKLQKKGEKAFIAYVTAGDPSLEGTVEIVKGLEKAGVDIIELGIPFSDPLADGRVNQEAAERALKAGATLHGVFECVARIRETSNIPIVFFSYMNPFYAQDFESSVQQAAAAGVDGMLLLDLPVEESKEFNRVLKKNKVDRINLITPTSPDERIAKIVKTSGGFVYCVSREGVTGMQDQLKDEAGALVRRIKEYTPLPVAVGFGISNEEQAAKAASYADGIIVGSAIVDRLHREGQSPEEREQVFEWISSLVKATKSERGQV